MKLQPQGGKLLKTSTLTSDRRLAEANHHEETPRAPELVKCR